ncbi:MAG: DNA primase noncatalytic subunit PriX [Candidatus Marsarchaeota archaeon]|nr:DNA primase noncatalytic subunit PriX [Candidatus Marsarchaeota archaeon]
MQLDKLDFAYKYPFSKEAKEVVASLNSTAVEAKYIQEGMSQLNGLMKYGRITHERARGITEVKVRYIMGYAYARMLVSALGDGYSISRFAAAEADSSSEFLALSVDDMLRICNEFGLGVERKQAEFLIGFESFVSVPKRDAAVRLINQKLSKGTVSVSVSQLLALARGVIEREVAKGLPIERKLLPKEVVEAAKSLKPKERKAALGARAGSYAWIEKLLANPIADVRHRSVNLILAPYLVNVKGMDEESAAKVIIDYIERCKQINPATKINESYIKYQCKYAKNKGMRPLSLTKARDLLKEVAEFE